MFLFRWCPPNREKFCSARIKNRGNNGKQQLNSQTTADFVHESGQNKIITPYFSVKWIKGTLHVQSEYSFMYDEEEHVFYSLCEAHMVGEEIMQSDCWNIGCIADIWPQSRSKVYANVKHIIRMCGIFSVCAIKSVHGVIGSEKS